MNFTEKQIWNLDTTIAGVIAEGLNLLAAEAEQSATEQLEGIEWVANIFADYSRRWDDDNFASFDPGHSRATELDDALIWLVLNFRNLWD